MKIDAEPKNEQLLLFDDGPDLPVHDELVKTDCPLCGERVVVPFLRREQIGFFNESTRLRHGCKLIVRRE